MENIILKDSYFASDSPIRGYVILKREDGTIIFKKENMIVEGGRRYIRDLISSKITDTALSNKISSIKFGEGAEVTTPKMSALTEPIDYTKDLVSSDKWFNVSKPGNGIGTLYTYISNEWNSGVQVNTGTTLPTTGLSNGSTFFNTTDGKLYTYTTEWNSGVTIVTSLRHINVTSVSSSTGDTIALRIDCRIVGEEDPPYIMVRELGLFLNDVSTTMFSRLTFEGVPFVDTMEYTLTYYIYF
jgi:hypothetical protein